MSGKIQREKLYEALAFFAANVRYAGQIKLYKLVYYLDLLHFRRTGVTVTGLTYEAWPMGPVPPELDQEFKDKSSTLHSRFDVQSFKRIESYQTPTIDSSEEEVEIGKFFTAYTPAVLKPRIPYKHRYLTKREMDLAKLLAEIFHDAKASVMSDMSHNKFGPWRKALFRAKQLGIQRPTIDLIEGVAAVGKPEEELSQDELREAVAERARIQGALM